MNGFLRPLNVLASLISWLTMAVLVVSVILKNSSGIYLWDPFIERWIVPVLTAASVGYLTNWIAIWLLFKPYKSHWGIQGVIPREQPRLGKALGEQIPQYLLKPEELAAQLGLVVKSYLQNPELLEDIREKVNHFLNKYSSTIADFLIPYIENSMVRVAAEHITPEKLSSLYDAIVVEWLSDEKNRAMLSGGLIHELKDRSPEISAMIRDSVRTGTSAYVKNKYPLISELLHADEFAANLVDWLDWDCINEQLKHKLEEEATRTAVSDELVNLTLRLQQYLRSEDGAVRLSEFIASNRERVETGMKDFLREQIPLVADQWLRRDEFWDTVELKLLPMIQSFILNRLKHQKEAIIEKFDIPGKIENSVRNLDVSELHEMINKVSGRHLVVIQLLGYVLGAAAGVLLILLK